MMLTHCGNNVRNRYSGCVFSVKDIVPVPLKTSRNPNRFQENQILMDSRTDTGAWRQLTRYLADSHLAQHGPFGEAASRCAKSAVS